jgi:regulatory protein SWI6
MAEYSSQNGGPQAQHSQPPPYLGQAPVGIDPQNVFQPPAFHRNSSNFHPMAPMPYAHPESFSKPSEKQKSSSLDSKVYSAVYSGVAVLEMMCRNVAVMRRQKDSFLNATQILKVANIDKGKRTKILEKEILNKEHEKVQGGYGKYQGTW